MHNGQSEFNLFDPLTLTTDTYFFYSTTPPDKAQANKSCLACEASTSINLNLQASSALILVVGSVCAHKRRDQQDTTTVVCHK
jgi:hypothetical protein